MKKSQKKNSFDSWVFLDSAGVARKTPKFPAGSPIFSQGDPADSVLYLRRGAVKFSVTNASGRQAVLAIFGPGDFLGEGCMAGQPIRMGTATAITPATALVMDKAEMLRALHVNHLLSEHFIRYMIARNIRIEEDLIAQLCDSIEKRLARVLLLLAGHGRQKSPSGVFPMVSQGTLAKMIGATRPRVNFFMNKFRKLGFIRYNNGKIRVNKSLLKVVLQN